MEVSMSYTKEELKQAKRNGAKQLAKLGKKMRQQQTRYFQTKSDEALRMSKKLEKQFDETVKIILK